MTLKQDYEKDYDDFRKLTNIPSFIRQAWKEEPEPHADGTPQASCSLRLNIEGYAKARKEFLKAETVGCNNRRRRQNSGNGCGQLRT